MAHALVMGSALPLIPDRPTLPKLREAAKSCRACPLWKKGTQTVFGEGSRDSLVVLVGEQPGDREDIKGRPFVGPAGRLLDACLEEAGIDRSKAYVTNVVKHFKWEPRGKKRIHQKPNSVEIGACRPWLDAELALIKPRVLVCLGATAAQALLGPILPRDEEPGILRRFQSRPVRDRHGPPVFHPPSAGRRREAPGEEGLRAGPSKSRTQARASALKGCRNARRFVVQECSCWGYCSRRSPRRRSTCRCGSEEESARSSPKARAIPTATSSPRER